MNRVRVYLCHVLVFLSISLTISSALNAATENSNHNIDLSRLSDIEHQINTQKFSYSKLKQLHNQLDSINANVTSCVANENDRIGKIEKILGYISTGLTPSIIEHNKYLIQEKAISKQKLAECSFVSYRSEEIIRLIESKISALELSSSWIKVRSVMELIHQDSFKSPGEKPVPETLDTLFKVLLVTAFILLLFSLSWIVFSLNYIKNKFSPILLGKMKWTLVTIYFVVIVLFLSGFRHAALMLIPKLALSAFIITIAYQLIKLISRAQNAFELNKDSLSRKVHSLLGLTQNEILPELVVIRSGMYLGIIVWSTLVLLSLWDFPAVYRDQLINISYHGITVFDLKIVPIGIGRAIVAFFVLMLSGRFLSTAIMNSNAFRKEKHIQLTISTLVRYATFIIATLLALYIAGISFTGVAIGVGALLVGVGFGLQQIVSDFIAGLILLSNNVVRPGDYVLVDDTEGTVMKIRLIATELHASGTTVLIPNSSFIGKSVTNYTHQGQVYYATIQVLIQQMADVKQAEKIMLDAASKNPFVINDGQHQVYVSIKPSDSLGFMGIYLSVHFPIATATASDQHVVKTEIYTHST